LKRIAMSMCGSQSWLQAAFQAAPRLWLFALLDRRVFARRDDFVQPARCGNCSITEPACLRYARGSVPTLIPQLLLSRDRTRALASKGVGFGSPIRLNFPTPPLRADCCELARSALWGSQSWLQPAFSRLVRRLTNFSGFPSRYMQDTKPKKRCERQCSGYASRLKGGCRHDCLPHCAP